MRKSFDNKYIIFIVAALVLTLIFGVGLCANAALGVAYAEADTFEAVFPVAGYFQFEQPSLIAAGSEYLAVYDSALSALFVRHTTGETSEQYSFDLDGKQVSALHLAGSTAFLIAQDGSYSLDLSQKSSSLSPAAPDNADDDNDKMRYFSNGDMLFAHHSKGGRINGYDSALSKQAQFENSSVAWQFELTADSDTVYAITIQAGELYFEKLSLSTSQSVSKEPIAYTAQGMQAGENAIFAMHMSAGDDEDVGQRKLAVISKQDGAVLAITDLAPDSYFAYGDKLYTVEDGHVYVYALSLTDDGATLKRIQTLSMAGEDVYHLNAPEDVVYDGGKLIVADSLNNRIAVATDGQAALTQIALDDEPRRIAYDGGNIYALTNSKILKIDGGLQTSSTIAEVSDDFTPLDLLWLDRLYILAEDGVYTPAAGMMLKLCDIVGGRRIAAGKGLNKLYVLKDDRILALQTNGALLTSSLTGDFADVKDIAVDSAGNIYAMSPTALTVYKNDIISLAKTSQTPLSSAYLKATANSVCLYGKQLYFTAEQCFVGRMTTSAVTPEEVTPAEPQIPADSAYDFVKLKDGESGLMLDADLAPDSLSAAPTDVLLKLAYRGDLPSEFAYALWGDKLIAIYQQDFEEVQTEPLSGDYVAIEQTTLYALPYLDSVGTTLETDVRIQRISDVAGYDGNTWWIVQLDEVSYFAKADSLKPYVYIPPKSEQVLGKAKAERIGGLVNVFEQADNGSAVLAQIVDGTKVEVLGTFGSFYMVKYGDIIGYMRTFEVKIGGLTTVQIIAIVLSIIVALAGAVIAIAIYNTRKKTDNDALSSN